MIVRFFMRWVGLLCDILVFFMIIVIWIIWLNMCVSGRNSSVDVLFLNSLGSVVRVLEYLVMKLLCVSM